MKVLLIIRAAIFLLIAVLLMIPIRLELLYENSEEKEKKAVLRYGFIKFVLYPTKKKDKPEKEEKEEKKEEEKEPFSFEKKKAELEKYIRIFKIIKDDAEKILSRLAKRAAVFDRIEVESEFGFDDAMQTGIFTGLYNGFVYSILGVIHHTSHLHEIDVKLNPNFEKKCFFCRFYCILHLKTVHIIIIAFNVLKIYRKIKNEGRK
ncbi:MAG: DUF2953 domain-containing protein [Clostridia bacterium]|nr:DUF2953 domain-containing protein [Clostridia bacterium]